MFTESGEVAEVDSVSMAAGDAHIIDVTDEFVSSQDIIAGCGRHISADAECSAGAEPLSSKPDTSQCQQAGTELAGLREAIASINVEDDLVTSGTSDVEVAIVLGGMDTNGEIFDDCLVFRLTM